MIRFLPRFRDAARAMEVLATRENWSREQIQAWQIERLNVLWGRATEHVPYYRDLARDLAIPRRFQSLNQFSESIPLLSRETFRSSTRLLLSEQAGKGTWKLTGGSTGKPTWCYWDHRSHREMLQAKYRFCDSWGVGVFDRSVFIWGHGASTPPGLRGLIARVRKPVLDKLRNRLRLSAYRLGNDDLRSYLRQIAAFRPTTIYAYSTAAYLLAQEALDAGFHCDSLKCVIVCAEPAYPQIVEMVERAFGVPCVNEYGSIECGLLASEGPDRKIRIREDIVFMESLPRNDGRFDLVVTGLINHSFPLIRYAIGDVTDAPFERTGTGFAALRNIGGRSNDGLRSGSGRFLHPNGLLHLIDDTLGLRRYHIHQRSDGRVSIQLELHNGFAQPDLALLKSTFEEHLEGYPVEIEIVNAVRQSPAGKHRWIHSELTLGENSPSRQLEVASQLEEPAENGGNMALANRPTNS